MHGWKWYLRICKSVLQKILYHHGWKNYFLKWCQEQKRRFSLRYFMLQKSVFEEVKEILILCVVFLWNRNICCSLIFHGCNNVIEKSLRINDPLFKKCSFKVTNNQCIHLSYFIASTEFQVCNMEIQSEESVPFQTCSVKFASGWSEVSEDRR